MSGRARGSRLDISAASTKVVSESDSIITARPRPATAGSPSGDWTSPLAAPAPLFFVGSALGLSMPMSAGRRPSSSTVASDIDDGSVRAGSFFGAGAMIEVASHDCNAMESSSSVGSTIVFTIEPVAACISTIPIAFFVGSIVIPNVSSPAHTASRSDASFSPMPPAKTSASHFPLSLTRYAPRYLRTRSMKTARASCASALPSAAAADTARQSEVPQSPTRPAGGERGEGAAEGQEYGRRGGAGAHRSSC